MFTPKGDPITLPNESTPVDFAYMVHSNIGDHCSKAMVNNKIVPLETKLESGDIVEIIVNKAAKPSRHWLHFVKTNKARSKIKALLNITISDAEFGEEDEQSVGISSRIEVLGKKAPLKLSKCCNPKPPEPIVAYYTKDKKITIHKKGCPNIHALDTSKEVPVFWKEDRALPVVKLKIMLQDKVGTLAKVLSLIASHNLNLKHITTKPSKENALTTISVEVDNELKLKEAINDLNKLEEVMDVKESKAQ